MIRFALVVLFVAEARASASVSIAASPRMNQELQGNFRIREGIRCGEHFDVVHITENNPKKCLETCLREERCLKYSIQSNGTARDCFLFDADVHCWQADGWITGNKDTRCGTAQENSVLNIRCPFGTIISDIAFASFGTPTGHCGNFSTSTCHDPMTKDIVADVCVGEQTCTIAASTKVFGQPCPIITKSLRVQAACEAGPDFNEDTYFNAWSSRHWPESELEVPSRSQEWTAFLNALPDYPEEQFSGRGIIVVAGGKYLESALVMIKMLRESGCELPVQVWHLGEAEMPQTHKKLLSPYGGVTTHNFENYVSAEALAPIQANVGLRLFQLKPLAILHSNLEEILLLDSDNCPVHDPSYLFDDESYRKVGTVFWPDFWKTSHENPIWKIIGQEPTNSWEQESGQILLRKSAAWKAINLCVHFNTEFYMRLLNGDKDTFRFSWLASGIDFLMIDHWPIPVGTLKELSSDKQGFCGHTMLQHDFDGTPLFVHHNQLKEAALAVGENFKYQKFPPASGHFKAVPVIGLKLANGATLPCIDVQDTGDPNVDEDRCIVNQTGLLDFERRYFEAKQSIPVGVFTTSTTSLNEKKSDELTHSVSQRLASPQRAMRSMIANILKKNKNTTCTPIEFEIQAPTFTNDRVCETTTVCETEAISPTPTTDRVCVHSTPSKSQFSVRVASGVYEVRNDSDPSVNTQYMPAMPLTLTRYHPYAFNVENVPMTEPFMITLNNKGGPDSNPYEMGIQSDRGSVQFIPTKETPSRLFYQSGASSNIGGQISIAEPKFREAFSESSNRFTTAYSPSHTIFTETDSLDARIGHSDSVGPNPMARLRNKCESMCASMPDCRGIFLFKTNKRTECHGLSNLGDGIADTKIDGKSIVKIVS